MEINWGLLNWLQKFNSVVPLLQAVFACLQMSIPSKSGRWESGGRGFQTQKKARVCASAASLLAISKAILRYLKRARSNARHLRQQNWVSGGSHAFSGGGGGPFKWASGDLVSNMAIWRIGFRPSDLWHDVRLKVHGQSKPKEAENANYKDGFEFILFFPLDGSDTSVWVCCRAQC